MAQRIGIEVSIAAAEAVKLCDVDAIAAYPITPQTHIVEHLSELVADGELDAEFIPVESEQSAMSVCMGTSAVGARTFTATAAQGLALMSEMCFVASSMRLPMVMVIVNRALNAPLSIWNDHSDIMAQRDCGWIQIFTENGQEVFDNIICAYKMAEDPRVLIPAIVNVDGFILSHVVEPIEFVDKELVEKFLPPFKPKFTMHPDNPVTMGAFGMPEIYAETKKAQDVALRNSLPIIKEVWEEWGKITGRNYHPVEKYKSDDAEVIYITAGCIGQTAEIAIDELRADGKSAGLIKLRLWRPFPEDDLKEAIKHAKRLIVVDRCYSFGFYNSPMASEIRSFLYDMDKKPEVFNFLAGIGGRDVPPDHFKRMFDVAEEDSKAGTIKNLYNLEVRE